MINQEKRRIVIRIGQRHLSFSSLDATDTEAPVTYEPYVMKSGIAVAANLREALKDAELREQGFNKVLVMIDAPVLLIPVEQFEESTMAEMYNQSFPNREQEKLLFNVLPDLNAVAVFSINKDLSTVISDNFKEISMTNVLAPVWRYMHRRSFTGARAKLYGYFHDQKLDIFAFQQNRFKFSNQFKTNRPQDALYFLLYVWKQLVYNFEYDELHLMGDMPDREWLLDELHKYLKKVYVINPGAEFNDAPATQIKNMPFDLVTLFTKGR